MTIKVPLDVLNIAGSPYASDIFLYVTHKDTTAFYVDDNGYIVQPNRNNKTGTWPQVISLRAFSPGTYEWRAKIENPASGKELWVGFGEVWSSNNAEASIMIVRNGAITNLRTNDGVGETTTDISASVDLTVLTTLKIVWISGTSVALYADGVLVATHTTHIPSVALHTFIEAHHETSQATHSKIFAHPELFNGDAKKL